MIMIQSKLFQKRSDFMKASESIANFESRLREYTNFTVREIKNICKQTGGRPAGSENEKKAFDYAQLKLKDFSDTIETQQFSVKPHALASQEKISGILLIISAVLSFLGFYLFYFTVISFVIAMFAFIQLIFNGKIFDLFFKKATSHNLYAKRNPSGDVKRNIIICGNMDSPFERTFIQKGGKKLEKAVKIYAFCGLAYILLFNRFVLLFPDKDFIGILKYIIIIFIPAFIALLFTVNQKKAIEGASGNLTGAFTALACMKFLSDNDIRFENTQVTALLTGSKNAGSIGAKEFFKNCNKQSEVKDTLFLEFDTIKDIEQFAIYSTNENTSKLLENAAKEAGIEGKTHRNLRGLPFDAKVAAKEGVAAATLTAVDLSSCKHYYTKEDTAENLEPKAIEKGVFIALSAIFQFDEHGLR